MIRIVNLRNYVAKDNEVLIKVDRSNKILGNKFYMKAEAYRNKVCDDYANWFNAKVNNNDISVMQELNRILNIARNNDIALGCWCYPKRCHSETIKAWLENNLNNKGGFNMKQKNIINKDITTITEGVIVHQVNNKHVMGAGLAKQLRAKYPQHYADYLRQPLNLGDVVATLINKNLVVCGLVAQDGYGRDKCYTVYNALAKSLMKVNKLATLANKPVYIPYGIGCGLAGGDWSIVESLIRRCCPQAIICKYSK